MGHKAWRVYGTCLHFLCVCDGGVLPHHTQTSAACCVVRQIQYIRDRPAPPLLSSRTSSYHILRYPPAEFTELSASPVTCLCLCMSLLETLDMLNTPIRLREFSTRLPQKIVCSEHSFAPTRKHTYTHRQTNFNLNMAYLQCMY